jgi:hypothetical protein
MGGAELGVFMKVEDQCELFFMVLVGRNRPFGDLPKFNGHEELMTEAEVRAKLKEFGIPSVGIETLIERAIANPLI